MSDLVRTNLRPHFILYPFAFIIKKREASDLTATQTEIATVALFPA